MEHVARSMASAYVEKPVIAVRDMDIAGMEDLTVRKGAIRSIHTMSSPATLYLHARARQ